ARARLRARVGAHQPLAALWGPRPAARGAVRVLPAGAGGGRAAVDAAARARAAPPRRARGHAALAVLRLLADRARDPAERLFGQARHLRAAVLPRAIRVGRRSRRRATASGSLAPPRVDRGGARGTRRGRRGGAALAAVPTPPLLPCRRARAPRDPRPGS